MAKYKIGDYLTGKEFIFFRVVVIINEESENPVFGLWTCKNSALQWQTLYEMDKRGIGLKEPDFDKFNSIQPGDVVFIDKKEGSVYMNCLARINDAVLLSGQSDAQAKMMLDMDKFFEEQTGSNALSQHERDELDLRTKSAVMNKSVGEWYSVDTMALMNWDVIRGEE